MPVTSGVFNLGAGTDSLTSRSMWRGVNTYGGDTFDIAGTTLVSGVNIASVADYDAVLGTTLNSGGAAAWTFDISAFTLV